MLKKIFLPTRQNNFQPLILRPLALSILCLILLLLPTAYNLTSAQKFQVLGYATDISVDTLYNLTNQQRTAAGLAPLSLNSKLIAASQAKAADMFAKNYWAHVSPDGLQPWNFISNAGYSYSYAGENLAKDFSTSSGVMAGWMGSAGHRANILNTNYLDVGFAVVNGTLLGSPTTLVVAEYARPAAVAAAPAPKPAPKPAVAATPAPASTTPVASDQPTPTAQSATPAPTPATTDQSKPSADKPPATAATTPTSTIKSQNLPESHTVLSYKSLNWAQRTSIFLIAAFLLMNVLRHTLVWRTQKRGWRHIWLRAHPAAQMGILAVALLAVGFSAFGVIQ
jgi:hypothetical protein